MKRKATRAAERAERQADVKKQKLLRDGKLNQSKAKLDHTSPANTSDHHTETTASGRQPDDDATFTLGENTLTECTEEQEQPDTQSESEAADGSGEEEDTDEEAELLEPLGASTSPSPSRLPKVVNLVRQSWVMDIVPVQHL